VTAKPTPNSKVRRWRRGILMQMHWQRGTEMRMARLMARATNSVTGSHWGLHWEMVMMKVKARRWG
jgi:hypothetical protein